MTPHKPPAMRYAIHKACACPFVICWIIGTCAIWLPLTTSFVHSGVFSTLLDDCTTIPLLLLCYAATSGLGFFGGALFFSWLILPFCTRFNGAPHEVGEQVIILSGARSGTATSIYEITTGQGGQPVPRVDLGAEAKEKFKDLYDEHCLLRISPRSTVQPAPPEQSQWRTPKIAGERASQLSVLVRPRLTLPAEIRGLLRIRGGT